MRNGVIDMLSRLLTNVKNRCSEFDVSEMSRALVHGLVTCRALERAVDRAEPGVIESLLAWSHFLLVHSLWVFDMTNADIFDLVWGQKAELNLLYGAQGRTRVSEVEVCHCVEDDEQSSKVKCKGAVAEKLEVRAIRRAQQQDK